MDRHSVVIDQVLHGYDRGHKELSASLTLDDQSRALMLEMSDSLVSIDMREGQSYLVAYPLRHASKHVLARTWAAGKGYRPGSVWTHSLVLDYQALTLIQDHVSLNALFSLPSESALNDYRTPIEFSIDTQSNSIVNPDSRTLYALTQLYSDFSLHDIVLPYYADQSDEILALSLWRQMWPALRREFAFSTCVLEYPLSLDSNCILRFSEREPLKKPLLNPDLHQGYIELLTDLPCATPTRLRTFLNRYVIEGKNPRKLAVPLAQLYSEIKNELFETRLNRVRMLANDFHLSRLMRDALTAELSKKSTIEELSTIIREFKDEPIQIALKDNLKLPPGASEDDCRKLLALTQSNHPDGLGNRIFEELVRTAPISILATVAESWSRKKMLAAHPELLINPVFWPRADNERAQFIKEIKHDTQLDIALILRVLDRPIGCETLDALISSNQKTSIHTCMELLQDSDKMTRHAASCWIVSNPDLLIDISMTTEIKSSDLVESLAAAQIFLHKKITTPKLWEKLILAIPEELIQSSTLTVSYITSLITAKTGDTTLIKHTFDKIQRAVSLNSLSPSEKAYIINSSPYYIYSDISCENITRSTILALANQIDFLGNIFNISENDKHLDNLASEAMIKYGASTFEQALESGRLDMKASAIVKLQLKKIQDKKKSWLKW